MLKKSKLNFNDIDLHSSDNALDNDGPDPETYRFDPKIVPNDGNKNDIKIQENFFFDDSSHRFSKGQNYY